MPIEAVRLSQILSAGGAVLSQVMCMACCSSMRPPCMPARVHPADPCMLGGRRPLLSQHADPLDEESYRGLVRFAPLDELGRRIRDASAWAPPEGRPRGVAMGVAVAASPEQRAHERARAFERRFAPRELVARALARPWRAPR